METSAPEITDANSSAAAAPAPRPTRTICVIRAVPLFKLERLGPDLRPNHRPPGWSRRPRFGGPSQGLFQLLWPVYVIARLDRAIQYSLAVFTGSPGQAGR